MAALVGAAGALFWGVEIVLGAPISLTGPAYTQNFDSIPTNGSTTTQPWVQDSSLSGWYVYQVTSVNATGGVASDITSIVTSQGGSNTGALYSFGNATTSPTGGDRALGSIGSNTVPGANAASPALNASIYYVARFVNNSGGTITSLSVTYTGEQWRLAQDQTSAQELQFQYYTATATPDFGNGPAQGGWSGTQSALTFIPPKVNTNPGAGLALDGNDPANRTTLSSTLNLTIQPGATFYFRWRDLNNTGNDHGVAIDDLTVSYTVVPIPEPASLLTLALPAVALRRRRRA